MTTDPITDAARVLLAAHTFGAVRLDAWVCAECGAPLAMPGWEAAVETTTGGLLREAMARHQTELLADAGLLAAPDLLQVGPRLGASACDDDGISVCPKMAYSNKSLQREVERLTAELDEAQERARVLRRLVPERDTHGQPIDKYIAGLATEAAQASRQDAPQAPADPPAGVESGQGAQHPTDRLVEDRLRALAADMDRDTPLTAEILRQFADEVTHLRAGGDRAIQSMVSRLPDGTYPTTPDGK